MAWLRRLSNGLGIAGLCCGLVLTASVAHSAPSRKPAQPVAKKVKPVQAKVVPKRIQAKAVVRPKAVVGSKVKVMATAAGASAVRAAAVASPALAHASVEKDLMVKSNAAMVMDLQTQEILFDKNAEAVVPIASLTKLMTGLLVTEAEMDLSQSITITEADVDTLKGSSSRLAVGTTLTRGELLHLALMSSENRAAHALGRTFPGGLSRFVAMMNAKAKLLGMTSTEFVDPTGLSPANRSSAKDLATLVSVAYEQPLLRELSTSAGYEVDTGRRTLHYRNTNRLVSNPDWDIGLQKTGYIAEAGRCLVMQATVAGRKLVMVFLDSAGKLTRVADAERVKRWLEARS